MKEKIDIVKDAFKVKNNKPYPKLNNLDYGDIFELNLFGITCSQFYLSSCILCLKENTSYCITCKNEFSLSEDETTKICYEVEKTDERFNFFLFMF